MSDDRIEIIEDRGPPSSGGVPPWTLLVVDDDDTVHKATRFALSDFSFEDRALRILSAYSASEARDVIEVEPDTALVLLDVVMESETIGLDLVRWIRDDMLNHKVRIVLRTGQPGFAPEFEVIRDYDINDYKEKSEMTAAKLVTTVYSALRSFRDIVALEEQADTLRHALTAAESASRAKTAFITHMSHEFRTPLNGILGLSEMIATEVLGPVGNAKYKEYAWDIVASGRQLRDLVESVLVIAERDDEKPLVLERFDLRGLIEEVFNQEVREVSWAFGGGADKRTAAQPASLMMRADRRAVRTMLANLVSNAVVHNPPHCKVRIAAKRVQDGGIDLSVVDNGSGIAPAILAKLGEHFNAVGGTNRYVAAVGGLGLGLVVTKLLIERHGGHLDIDSTVGSGTTVRLHFPPECVVSQKR